MLIMFSYGELLQILILTAAMASYIKKHVLQKQIPTGKSNGSISDDYLKRLK